MTTTTKIVAAAAAAAVAVGVWVGLSRGTSSAGHAASPVSSAAAAPAPSADDPTTPPPFAIKSRPDLNGLAPGAQDAPSPSAKSPALPGGAAAKPRPSLKPAAAGDAEPALMRKLGLYQGPSRGTANAPITIVVFTDFHCRFCGTVLGTLDQLLDEYKGKVRVVSKMFPVKPGSKELAKAAVAAGKQGKFWEMTDLLYANQDKAMPDKAQLTAYARQLGLDTTAFASALASPAVEAEVMQQIAAGTKLGVRGTPTVFVNGKKVMGAQPIANFRKAIDAKLDDE